jgi:hypothetical protein
MNKTPETDEAQHEGLLRGNPMPTQVVHVNFARKLEQSRDEWAAMCGRYKQERDEAMEALADWENAAAHVEADHPDEKHCGCVPVLRKLLTDAREKLDEEMKWHHQTHKELVETQCKLMDVSQERDDAREQIKELIYIADRAIDLAEIDFENDKFGVVSELRNDLEKIKESK